MQPSRSLVPLALAAALAVSVTGCRSDDPDPATALAPSPTIEDVPGQDILFQREGTKRYHVAWVAPDGSGEEGALPDFGDGHQTNPDWSPDGTRFVFPMVDGTTEDLFVATAGAADATKLVDCVAPCLYLDDPAWSPDGDRIAYSRTIDRHGAGVSTLETVDVATGEVRVLLGPWRDRFTAGVRWSPDGRQVVFELVYKVASEVDADLSGVTLTTLDLADGTRRDLTDPALWAATADWSPDGRWIVYSGLAHASDEAADLFRVSARGGYPHQLTHLVELGGYAAEPTFTPEGRAILFSGGRDADERDLLLQVDAVSPEVELATGDVEVHGRHPRVR